MRWRRVREWSTSGWRRRCRSQICSRVPLAELGPVASRHLPGRGVDQRARSRPFGPLLGAGAVAVVQLDLRAVGRAGRASTSMHLPSAWRVPSRADRPLLRGGAVAVVELDGGAVGAAGAGDVDALAAVAGDLAGAAVAAAALRAVPREGRGGLGGQGVGERLGAPVDLQRCADAGVVVGDQRLGAVGVAPGDVRHGAVGGGVDAVARRASRTWSGGPSCSTRRCSRPGRAAVAVVHGDQSGAGAAAAVVRALFWSTASDHLTQLLPQLRV